MSSGGGPSPESFVAGIELHVCFYSFCIEVDVSLDPSATDRDKAFDAMNLEKELSWSHKTLEVVWLE